MNARTSTHACRRRCRRRSGPIEDARTAATGGWDARRAAVCGVLEEEPGAHDATRTPLEREVLPGHVAHRVRASAADECSHTIGPLVPVDAGVVATFLR